MFSVRDIFANMHVSMEAESLTGRTEAEIERVLYARVANFDWLDRAVGAERQQQWHIPIPKTSRNKGSGSIRMRKSINLREAGAAPAYTLTTKLEVGTHGNHAETSEPSSSDQFRIFRYMADFGMSKDRYYFPVTGTELKWEVDCVPKKEGLYHEWVKIDLEKWPSNKDLPQLPFQTIELIDTAAGKNDQAIMSKVEEIFNKYFLKPNQMDPVMNYEQANAVDEIASLQPSDGNTTEQQPNQTPDTSQDDQQPPHHQQAQQPAQDNNQPQAEQPNQQEQQQNQHPANDKIQQQEQTQHTPAQENTEQNQEQQSGENNEQDKEMDNKNPFDTSTESFSNITQTALNLLFPILGPSIYHIWGSRAHGYKDGDIDWHTRQHTALTIETIDRNGRYTNRNVNTGSYDLMDLKSARKYIDLITDAAVDAYKNVKKLSHIKFTLWPQVDGKSGLISLGKDADDNWRFWNENNPGKLEWFDTSLSGKRTIHLADRECQQYKLNDREIIVPFDGKIVNFDVSQLRALDYTVEESNGTITHYHHKFDTM